MKRCRYIESEPLSGPLGLATDEAIMSKVDHSTLHLYTYRPHAALVGRYQSLADEVDLRRCSELGFSVSRRSTGGGAIIMGPGQLAVAYVLSRADPVSGEPAGTCMSRLAEGLIGGLATLGIAADFSGKNDLVALGRKIAGLGIYRDAHGATLLHASLLVDLDLDLMIDVLKIPDAKLAREGSHSDRVATDAVIEGLRKRLTTVSAVLGETLCARDVLPALRDGMVLALGLQAEPGVLEETEISLRDRLVREKYSHPDWVEQPIPTSAGTGQSVLRTPVGLFRFHLAMQGETIKSVLVTGDFNEPPDGLRKMESALKWGCADDRTLRSAVERYIQGDDLGAPTDAVVGALKDAVQEALKTAAPSTHELRSETS